MCYANIDKINCLEGRRKLEKYKKLIVFYSYTGHTKMIAEIIKEKLNCDILELKPCVPYSDDYDQVVEDEQNSGSSQHIPSIQEISIDLNLYEEIILGTPTWWYRPCPVIRSFLLNYDLSHKIIIPFATNAGWLGRTFSEIKKLCPNSKVEKGLNIVFTENYKENKMVTSMEEVQEFIHKLL